MEEAHKQMVKARSALILGEPFFGTVALKLRLVREEGIPTLATDGEAIYYNPEFVCQLGQEKLRAAICHEVFHVILLHPWRRKNRHHERWNIAGDFAINPMLQNSGFTLDPNWLLDPKFEGMTADMIYTKLPKPKECKKSCGGLKDHPGFKPGASQEEKAGAARAEADMKVTIAQAAAMAKMAGKLPGGLEHLVKDIINPRINYIDHLRRFIEDVARNDYSWLRPNRRHVHQGIYLPSLYNKEMGEMVISIDTSGSISSELLDEFLGHVSAILETVKPREIHVIYCDTKVANVEDYTPEDMPIANKAKPKGRGGTDFRPPFKHVEEQGWYPKCMIYLTDLECNTYPKEPDYPVLWVATKPTWAKSEPPFGEFIEIK